MLPAPNGTGSSTLQTQAVAVFAIVSLSGLILITMKLFQTYSSMSHQNRRKRSLSETLCSVLWTKSTPQSQPHQGPVLSSLTVRPSTPATPENKQLEQITPSDMQSTLTSHIKCLKSTYSRSTYLGHSTFESPPKPALYGKHKYFADTHYLGLICSLEPGSSGGLSLCLHADDVASVVATGWGKKTGANEVRLPAARDEGDLAVYKVMLLAAVAWVCKGELEDGEDAKEDGESVVRPQWLLPKYVL